MRFLYEHFKLSNNKLDRVVSLNEIENGSMYSKIYEAGCGTQTERLKRYKNIENFLKIKKERKI